MVTELLSTQTLMNILFKANTRQLPYLARGLYALPDARVHDGPGEDEAQKHLPLDTLGTVYAWTDVQRAPVPEVWRRSRLRALFNLHLVRHVAMDDRLRGTRGPRQGVLNKNIFTIH